MRHLEDSLQKACVQWFGLQYPEHALLLHHSPNGGFRNPVEAAKFKSMGTRAGFPDLILLLPSGGHPFLSVELKTKRGSQSDAQRRYQKAVEEVGGIYYVIRSVEEFIQLINQYINQ